MMFYRGFFVFLVIALLMMLLDSCSRVLPEVDVKVNYKMDLTIKNMAFRGRGMLVLPQKDLYTFEFYAPGNFDYFTFETCSREISIEDPKKGFKINYKPNLIEKHCGKPIIIRAFDIKTRHAMGIIEFEDPYTTLKGMLVCGGETKLYNGVSVCQQREGLTESITFETDVQVRGCGIEGTGQTFEFQMPKGLCEAAFLEIAKPNRLHRLTLFGYENILIRK